MDPPNGSLAPLAGVEALFRVLLPKLVPAHTAHKGQMRIKF